MKRKFLLRPERETPNAQCKFNGRGAVDLGTSFDLNIWMDNFTVEAELFYKDIPKIQGVISFNGGGGFCLYIGGSGTVALNITGSGGFNIPPLKIDDFNQIKVEVINTSVLSTVNGITGYQTINRKLMSRTQSDYYGLRNLGDTYLSDGSILRNIVIKDGEGNIVLSDFYTNKNYNFVGEAQTIQPI